MLGRNKSMRMGKSLDTYCGQEKLQAVLQVEERRTFNKNVKVEDYQMKKSRNVSVIRYNAEA